MMGTIFAIGLPAQCKVVEKHVKKMLNLPSSSFLNSISTKKTVDDDMAKLVLTLNVVGLSRGGIAAIQLAQMLYYISPDRIKINLLLFDPVPGNLITSSKYLDPFSFNTANSALDLSYCHNICDVLALYPYQPLPDMAFHAPILPRYPSNCNVEEDATLGCHQGALFCSSKSIESRLSYFRIHEWLENHGTKFDVTDDESDFTAAAAARKLSMTPLECKKLMDEVMQPPDREVESVIRHTHSSPSGAVIYLHGLSREDFFLDPPVTRYLNKHHQYLSERLKKIGPSQHVEAKSSDEVLPKIEFLVEVSRPSQSSSLFSSCSSIS